jgi:hypothetical protein
MLLSHNDTFSVKMKFRYFNAVLMRLNKIKYDIVISVHYWLVLIISVFLYMNWVYLMYPK